MDESPGFEPPEAPELAQAGIWLWHHFRQNVQVFMKAPVIVALGVMAFAGYWIGERDATRRTEESKTAADLAKNHIAFLNDEIAAYKDRLHGATPDEAAHELVILKGQVKELGEEIQKLEEKSHPRPLTPDMADKILSVLKSKKQDIPWIMSYVAANNDTQSQLFAYHFTRLISNSAHLPLDYIAGGVCEPDEKGITLYLPKVDTPSEQSKIFMKALDAADIHYSLKVWEDRQRFIPADFLLFVCPD